MQMRRPTLRDSFLHLIRKPSASKNVRRLKGVHLFKVIVRRVLEFMEWFQDAPVAEEAKDDIGIHIQEPQETKVEKKGLTLEDRSNLLTRPEERTTAEIAYIYKFFKKYHAFEKYNQEIRQRLAEACLYQYLQPGRVIVRQDHPARNLYFIVTGECSLSKIVTDRWTGQSEEVDMGTLIAGEMFGKVALLHTTPRSATVISKTIVDLLMISLDDFNKILRDTLTKEWDVLQDALVNFNYFKNWTEKAIRECCVLSKMREFQPDQVLLGDGKGMVNYAHFVMEGECCLIEHMLVREEKYVHGIRYELFNPKLMAKKKKVAIRTEQESEETAKHLKELEYEFEAINVNNSKVSEEFVPFLSRSLTVGYDHERASVITTTMFDVMNEWHKITDVSAMLMRQPSPIYLQCYPHDVRTIFMQICTFTRGACFGLGENMVNRRVVSTTPVRCFLIPRYWLNEHNRANIWERVKLFMDSKFPTKEELFKKFVDNRKWLTYKKNMVQAIGKKGRYIHSNVTMHDVPYSIRITNVGP